MPRNFLPVLESLERRGRPFSTAEFARAAQVCHQRASVVLAKMRENGLVVRVGEGRGARYARALPSEHGTLPPFSFWASLCERVSELAYVPLLPFGPQLRTTAKGREVRAIYPPKPFTILDFAGITQVSNAFLNTLLQPARDTPWPTEFQPIHASAAVRAALALRRWRGDLAAGNTQPLEVDGTDFYDAG